jgi:Ice-binding-like/IPT/TIG domain
MAARFESHGSPLVRRRRGIALIVGSVAAAMAVVSATIWSLGAFAAQPTVGLGTATPFAILAGSAVTNTGNSVVMGDLGVSPGASVTGFPPGTVSGTQHLGDTAAQQAEADLTTAYNDAAGRTPANSVTTDLGGQMLDAGVYQASAASLSLTGTLTLDGQNNANAVFIFQASSTLTTATNSTVNLINGASACNVFWQVGSAATLGTGTTFEGSILALSAATIQTGASVTGRVLVSSGAVTLDANVITDPSCPTTPPSTTTTTTTAAPVGTTTSTTTNTSTTTTTPPGATGPIPTVTGVTPSSGPTAGGTSFTVTGSGFSTTPGGTVIDIGGSPATQVTCTSSAVCTGLTPAGSGSAAVIVIVDDHPSSSVGAPTFTYVTPGLAFTGSNASGIALGGLTLIGLGALSLVVSRRRRPAG